jgi:hypothetical protein
VLSTLLAVLPSISILEIAVRIIETSQIFTRSRYLIRRATWDVGM